MHHAPLVQRIVDRLKSIEGVKAIVLGGSYASGSQRPDSYIDSGEAWSVGKFKRHRNVIKNDTNLKIRFV
jgi:Nucleotidyltransferase domain